MPRRSPKRRSTSRSLPNSGVHSFVSPGATGRVVVVFFMISDLLSAGAFAPFGYARGRVWPLLTLVKKCRPTPSRQPGNFNLVGKVLWQMAKPVLESSGTARSSLGYSCSGHIRNRSLHPLGTRPHTP